MTTKIEAEKSAELWKQESDKRHGYVNPALAYSEGMADYKSRLREELLKRKGKHIRQVDNARFCECNDILDLLDTIKPSVRH